MISSEMARFLRNYNLRPVEASWPKAGTLENLLASAANRGGLLSVKPVRAGWCRFQTTEAGAVALKEFDAALKEFDAAKRGGR